MELKLGWGDLCPQSDLMEFWNSLEKRLRIKRSLTLKKFSKVHRKLSGVTRLSSRFLTAKEIQILLIGREGWFVLNAEGVEDNQHGASAP